MAAAWAPLYEAGFRFALPALLPGPTYCTNLTAQGLDFALTPNNIAFVGRGWCLKRAHFRACRYNVRLQVFFPPDWRRSKCAY